MMSNTGQHVRRLVEDILGRHPAAAIDALVAALEDEIEERVRDRVADLRQQLEGGNQ
jgi:hypothetical protein